MPGEDRSVGRVLGIDVGEKRIGIAVSDPLGKVAGNMMTLTRSTEATDLAQLGDLVRDREVTAIVVGLPRRTDGSEGPEARLVMRFAAKLERAAGVPVVLWDERYTTAQAEKLLVSAGVRREKRRLVVDKVAAGVILQSYLDRSAVDRSAGRGGTLGDGASDE